MPDFDSLFDKYLWQARLSPAILTVTPALFTVYTWKENISKVLEPVVATLLIGAAVSYFAMQVVRDRGRALETRLFEQWGGKPTTQLLRFRDKTIEQESKDRWLRIMSTWLNESPPRPEDELLDPVATDSRYNSYVSALRQKNREGIVLAENIQYGFRRNMLGIKPIGLLLSLWCVVIAFLRLKTVAPSSDLAVLCIVAEVVSSLFLLAWLFVVTEAWVKDAAFIFAEQLLRATDTIEEKSKT